MRSLFFRAWDEKEKLMIDGDFIEENHPTYTAGMSYGKLFIANHADGEWYDCVVMQGTGLFDSTGKRIFEGDILRDDDSAYIAQWHKDGSWGAFYVDEEGETWCECLLSDYCKENEIIGNIYENPDMFTAIESV